MFKASIALVIFAFGALIYGWVQGIDSLLYGSIAFSALAGVALLRSTMVERKKFASARKAVKKEAEEQVHSGRATLAELSARARTEAAAADDPFRRTRTPIKPFGDSAPPPPSYPQDEFGPDVEGDDLIQRTLNWVDASDEEEFEERTVPRGRSQAAARIRPPAAARERSQSTVRRIEPERRVEPARPVEPARRVQARRPAASSPTEDFRARLASVLGDPDPPPPPVHYEDPEDEVQQEWIRIEDVPRIARATQKDGGYARPELPSVQPPKRRTTPTPKGAAMPKSPAPRKPVEKPEPATPRRRTTGPPKAAGTKAAPAKAPATRTRAASVKPPAKAPTADVADNPAPRGRPRAQP